MIQGKNEKPLGAIFATVALVALVLVVFGMWRPWHTVENEDLSTVRVAYLPIYVDLPLFVAMEQKIFRSNGVDVELVKFGASPDMGNALVNGQVDAVASIATHSALAIESRDPGQYKIFLVDAESSDAPLSALMVKGSSAIDTVADLNGKIIASFPGPTTNIWAPLALKQLGLEESEYQISAVDIGSHIVALESDRVDAIITYEPTATLAEYKYGAKRLVPGLIESNVIDPWQAGVWIIDRDFLSKQPELADRFMKSIYEAVESIEQNPERAKRSLLNFTSIDLDIALQTPTIPFTTAAEADLVTLQRHADLLFKKGELQKEIEIPKLMINN